MGARILNGAGTLTVEIQFDRVTWTDVSADVYNTDQVSITQGRVDETSQCQPASCAFTLKNPTGAYTAYDFRAAHSPGITRGTPVRVSYDPGTGPVVLFYGEAVGFTPAWADGRFGPRVQVSAAGILRRLTQGVGALQSELAYTLLNASPDPVLYLPMEDSTSALAGRLVSGLPGAGSTPFYVGDDLGISTVPQWASGNLGSAALPAPVADVSNGSHIVLSSLPAVPASGWAIDQVVSVSTDDRGRGESFWPVIYVSGSSFPRTDFDVEIQPRGLTTLDQVFVNIFVVQANGSSSSSVLATINTNIFDGSLHHFRLAVSQSGGNINWTLYLDGNPTSGSTAGTLQAASEVEFNPFFFNTHGKFAVGHLVLWGTATPPVSAATEYTAASGHVGETADTRIVRLCARQGVPVTVTGTSNTTMGAQPLTGFIDLLRECEAADGGVLHDGFDAGLGYICRSVRYNLATALALNAATTQLGAQFTPVDDDQRTVNQMTVSRSGGGSATFQDVNGSLGTAAIGIYDSSTTVNTDTDGTLLDVAAWKVHLGTVEGFRYPSLQPNVVRSPSLIGGWIGAGGLGFRVDVTHIGDVLTQHPIGTVSLIVEGYSHAIDQSSWTINANCSPFTPWRVFKIEDPVLGRIDSTDTVLTSGAAATATAITVTPGVAGEWTNLAASFPFDLSVGGQQVTAVDEANGTSIIAQDGTFEVVGASSGWTPTSCTFANDAAHVHGGAVAAKMVVTGTPAQAFARMAQVSGIVVGDTYTLQGWAFATSITNTVQISIDWFTGAGVFVSTSNVSVTIAANTWTRLQVVAVAPATAGKAGVGPTLGGTPATGLTVWWDDFTFTHQVGAAGSTQTFTVVRSVGTVQVFTGARVSLWHPGVLAL